MKNKFSVIVSMLGALHDRFAAYGEKSSMYEIFEWLSKIEGVEGVELIYPFQFQDINKLKINLNDYKLDCSAVNVNLKTKNKYHRGSLTNIDPGVRKSAIEDIKNAMDISVDIGCKLLTICPLADGHDYPLEVNYSKAWGWLIEGLAEAAEYRKDVKISLEYKRNETRTHCMLSTAGITLHLCDLINLPNIGVTLDFGHSVYGGETPAEIVSILNNTDRLFLVHVNDNYRDADWDLIPGSINFWDWLEFVFYLDMVGYSSWFTSDVFPARLEPKDVVKNTYKSIITAKELIKRLDKNKLIELINQENYPKTNDYILNNLFDL